MPQQADEQYEDFDEQDQAGAGKPRYSKVIVAVCLVLILAFTVTQFIFLWYNKPLNDVQTVGFYLCFGFEFASLAFVTRGKLKYSGGNGAGRQVPHIEIEEVEDGRE